MAKSILINSFSLCQNLSAPEKFGIDAVGNLTDNENLSAHDKKTKKSVKAKA